MSVSYLAVLVLYLSTCEINSFSLNGQEHRIVKRASKCPEKYLKFNRKHSACLDVVKRKEDGVSDEDKKLIVAAHNLYRGAVNPPATNMMALEWDDEIAMIAQKWASQCKSGHDEGSARKIDRFYNGQNAFSGSGGNKRPWTSPVRAWHNEVNNFKYGNGSSNGGVIGHFTQVVWATTRYVGCGYAKCGEKKYKYICNYGPGGNLVKRIPTPYTSGKRGSECPSTASYNSKTGLCGGLSSYGDISILDKQEKAKETTGTSSKKTKTKNTKDKTLGCKLNGKILLEGETGTKTRNGKQKLCTCTIKKKSNGKMRAKLMCKRN